MWCNRHTVILSPLIRPKDKKAIMNYCSYTSLKIRLMKFSMMGSEVFTFLYYTRSGLTSQCFSI